MISVNWCLLEGSYTVSSTLPLLDGIAIRVPVEDGSLTDLTVILGGEVSSDEVNAAFADAAAGPLKGVLRVTTAPIVSRDVIGDPASCVFDALLTQARETVEQVDRPVAAIIAEIRARGDAALIDYTARFDRLALTPDQTQLLHLLERVDPDPRLLAGAFIELREIGLARYLPKQILMG